MHLPLVKIARAFTLIELLVVIAIVGILGALLLTAMNTAKTKAQAIGRVNNVRQLGLAFKLYVDDYNLFPEESRAARYAGGWLKFLESYYHGRNVLLCPATRDVPVSKRIAAIGTDQVGTADMPYRRPILSDPPNIVAGQPWTADVYLGSYAVNAWLISVYQPGPELLPFFIPNESAVTDPARTPVFADGQITLVIPQAHVSPPRDLYYSTFIGLNSLSHLTLARHGGSGTARRSLPVAPGQSMRPYVNNLACYDGHVERTKLDNLWQERCLRRWIAAARISLAAGFDEVFRAQKM